MMAAVFIWETELQVTQKKWESFEDVTTYLLNEMASKFGLERVEPKQTIKGMRVRRSKSQIDAKGVLEANQGFLIIECKRHTKSRIKQEVVEALAFRILNTGAQGGIIVSPLGLQTGAAIIANHEHIHSVQLNENSTRESYILKFLNEIFAGVTDRVQVSESVCVVLQPSSDDLEASSDI
jgi:Restriction endonuclease